jgi:hypothetical protein
MEYRIYTLNQQSQPVGPAHIIKAETDEDAIAEAKKRFQGGRHLELRQDARIVITLRAGTVCNEESRPVWNRNVFGRFVMAWLV